MRSMFSVFMVLVLTLGWAIQDAEAKRFGGGKSFGSKPMFSQPAKRTPPPAQKPQATPDQAKPATGAAAAGAGAAAGGAAKSGMMGMLGGLALGGLLGAMFFGGAFEGINFMDVLIFGLIAFLLFKLLAGRRRVASQGQPAAAGYGRVEEPMQEAPTAQPQERRAFDTDLLFKKDKTAGSAATGVSSTTPRVIHKPAGFDEQHFIEGAKVMFVRMQKAWDEGELADIRQFTTDHVFAEIQDQFRAREGEHQTEVLSAQAELFDVAELDNEMQASVLFTVSMKENGEEVEVEEVWHFVKPKHAIAPTWFLDGIQQVEE